MQKLNITKGNEAHQQGRLSDALGHYLSAIEEHPELKKTVQFNIDLINRKLKTGQFPSRP
jgi:hypothetical protein